MATAQEQLDNLLSYQLSQPTPAPTGIGSTKRILSRLLLNKRKMQLRAYKRMMMSQPEQNTSQTVQAPGANGELDPVQHYIAMAPQMQGSRYAQAVSNRMNLYAGQQPPPAAAR